MNELTQFTDRQNKAVAWAESVIVESEDGVKEATAGLKKVKELYKEVENKRKDLVQPLNDTVKKINANAKEITEPLKEAESIVKRKIGDYQREVLIKQQEEQRKIEEARKKETEKIKKAQEQGEEVDTTKAQELFMEQRKINTQDTAIRAGGGTASTRLVWKFEIVDPKQVPDEYKVVDEKAIRFAVQYQDARDIPGVRIYQDTQVTIR